MCWEFDPKYNQYTKNYGDEFEASVFPISKNWRYVLYYYNSKIAGENFNSLSETKENADTEHEKYTKLNLVWNKRKNKWEIK